MESLAVAAAVVVLSIISVSVLALVFAAFGFRWMAALTGGAAILAGGWLLVTVPTLSVLAAACAAAGIYAIWSVVRSGAAESRETGHRKSDVKMLIEHINSSQRSLIFEQEQEIARLQSALSAYTDNVSASGESKFSLTDAEREAIENAAEWAAQDGMALESATLRGLLERRGSGK